MNVDLEGIRAFAAGSRKIIRRDAVEPAVSPLLPTVVIHFHIHINIHVHIPVPLPLSSFEIFSRCSRTYIFQLLRGS